MALFIGLLCLWRRRYVDELNQEIVRMEEEIVATRKEIEVFRGGTVGLTSRKKVLAEIEDRLHETEVKAESYERKYQSAMKTVATLKVRASDRGRRGCSVSLCCGALARPGVFL